MRRPKRTGRSVPARGHLRPSGKTQGADQAEIATRPSGAARTAQNRELCREATGVPGEPAEAPPAEDSAPTHTALDGVAPARRSGVLRSGTGVFLEVMSGAEVGHVFDLRKPGVYVIGRRHGEISLDDGRCSRKHAQIEILADGEYYLADLASTNGTYLNDVRTTRRRLRHMDIVRTGRTKLRFTCIANAIPVGSD